MRSSLWKERKGETRMNYFELPISIVRKWEQDELVHLLSGPVDPDGNDAGGLLLAPILSGFRRERNASCRNKLL
jgi:hypothetical protein